MMNKTWRFNKNNFKFVTLTLHGFDMNVYNIYGVNCPCKLVSSV